MSRQRVEHVQPAAAVAELEIADHDIRWPYPRLRDLHRLLAVLGGTDLATPAFHEDLDAFEDDRLVIDDQYAQPRHVQWLVGGRRRGDLRTGRRGYRDVHAEQAAVSKLGMQGDRDLQQRAQALYSTQPEAEDGTFAGPGRAVRLVELLEHAHPMLVRDARSRVPDVDAQSARLPARAHQHAAAVGVADRVADQVVEDARQHDPVAAHP